MIKESSKEKARSILKSKTNFPNFNLIDYNSSLRENLNFYNNTFDASFKKLVTLEYWKTLGKDVSRVSKVPECWFTTCGAVAHMLFIRELPLEEKHILYLENKFNFLKDKIVIEKVEKTEKLDNTEKEISQHCGEFEHGLDLLRAGKVFDVKAYLVSYDVKPQVAKKVADWFKRYLKEIKLISTEEQLAEGYANYSKREMKLFKESVEYIISSCEVASAITKAARKPKVKKDRDPYKVIKNIKYMSEFPDLNLKSVSPLKLVCCDEVWIFNTKVRRLFKYIALQGNKISVRGTSLTNIDIEQSGGKILRKPDVQLKDVDSFTSRPLNKLFNEIRATESKPTGRINEDCIILKIF